MSGLTANVQPDRETATRARNRNRILDATSQLLSSGERLAKLSIDRIAKAAEMSRATFYLHFKSKHDLIAALAQRELAPWTSMVASTLAVDQITRDQVQQIASVLIEVYRANQGTMTGIIEMAEYDDETRQAWQETIESVAQQFQTAIQRWRPELPEPEASELARVIVWAGERYLHQRVGNAEGGDDQTRIWALTEMAWRLMND